MKKNLNEELKDVYYLLGYDRNKILSEQAPIVEDASIFELEDVDDMGTNEFTEADMPSIAPSKPGIKTPTKPNKPGTPYKPKVKPAPKAKKSDLPDWLTFDELGIEF
jgi:hypothetical protein